MMAIAIPFAPSRVLAYPLTYEYTGYPFDTDSEFYRLPFDHSHWEITDWGACFTISWYSDLIETRNDANWFHDFTAATSAGGANFNNPGTPAPVPEPSTMLLLGTGLVGLAGFRRKFKK